MRICLKVERKVSRGTFTAAMANPRPLELSNAALQQSLKNAILEQNRLDL
jgi:hypothetical protein